MTALKELQKKVKNNYESKNEIVDLKGSVSSQLFSLKELESYRAENTTLSASKNGLETICGVSCATGAQ